MRKHYCKKIDCQGDVIKFLDEQDNKITVISIDQIENSRTSYYLVWFYEEIDKPEIKTKTKKKI